MAETNTVTITEPSWDEDAVRAAGKALADGCLVIFPTETVYGVGASAVHAGAVEDLSHLKNRTPDRPFTIHLAESEQAERFAGPLPRMARRLIRKAWPGPLTLVVPDRRPDRGRPPGLVEEAIYHEGTVGLRCVSHAVGRAVLRAAGVPVVGTSANLAGRPAPRRLAEALADLKGLVPLAIDAGPTQYAQASTVVRIRGEDSYEVLRKGAVPERRLERLARTRILLVCTGNLCRSPMAAGIARKILADRLGCSPEELQDRGIDVASAGTGAIYGYPASEKAIRAMAQRGIDIGEHRSQPLTVDSLLGADYIWVMARGHMDSVTNLAPEASPRVAMVDPSGRDVADPIGGDEEAYRRCAEHLEAALAQRLAEIV
jgi:protein-tyrosine phosphatase